MNEQEKVAIVERYLKDLEDELGQVPASRRRELVEDVHSHIEEAWVESEDRSHAALLNILDRLGSPQELAREERERLGIGAAPQRHGPGFLEAAAVVMTVIFWPVGVLLAWLSPRWLTRDKVVATLLPVLGLAVLLATSMAAFTSVRTVAGPAQQVVVVSSTEESSNSPADPRSQPQPETTRAPAPDQAVDAGRVESRPSRPPWTPPAPEVSLSWPERVSALLVRLLALFGLLGAPLVSAIYLAMRMLPNPRRSAVLLPAAVGVSIVLGVLGAFLAPVVA